MWVIKWQLEEKNAEEAIPEEEGTTDKTRRCVTDQGRGRIWGQLELQQALEERGGRRVRVSTNWTLARRSQEITWPAEDGWLVLLRFAILTSSLCLLGRSLVPMF